MLVLIRIMMSLRERERISQFSSGRRIGKSHFKELQSITNHVLVYREEMFKQKRAFTGEGATNTPAGATN